MQNYQFIEAFRFNPYDNLYQFFLKLIYPLCNLLQGQIFILLKVNTVKCSFNYYFLDFDS